MSCQEYFYDYLNHTFNPDNLLGREMMVRRFVRQFWRLEGVHGRSMDDAQATKMMEKRPSALA